MSREWTLIQVMDRGNSKFEGYDDDDLVVVRGDAEKYPILVDTPRLLIRSFSGPPPGIQVFIHKDLIEK